MTAADRAQHLDLLDLRHRVRQHAREIALALLGKPNFALSSRAEWRWGRKGSLALVIAGPKQGVWFDHQAGQGNDLLALIQRERGCDFGTAVNFALHFIGRAAVAPAPAEPTKAEDRRRPELVRAGANRAVRIWRESTSIAGTLGETYLAVTRSIDISQLPDVDDVLRFHPRCVFGDEHLPCVIALMRDIFSNEPVGIIRTAISAGAEKLGRKMLGRKAGAAVKLWPNAAVTGGLVVGEGLETVAAAATRMEYRATLLQPAWALCDTGNLAHFGPRPGIEFLTVLTDHDAGRAGEDAAETCARRWLAAGQEVELLVPHALGADFADLVAEEVVPA
jgi:putative DNA primase/helicase